MGSSKIKAALLRLWRFGGRVAGSRAVGTLAVVIVVVGVITAITMAAWGKPVPVLQTHGLIADQERNLILITVALGVVVVVPVFILLIVMARRYRAGNTKAVYQPEYDGNHKLEALWWGIPCLIIFILGVITVYSTHALDPYKPIAPNKAPLNVEVVALQWKWLFIYPDQGIATVNYLNVPVGTPINLSLTADAPMNSFWVPALAGQIYAMPGMSTQLHIEADDAGTYQGSSANISGDGFASMRFVVNAESTQDFNNWQQQTRWNTHELDFPTYARQLSPAGTTVQNNTYALADHNLYNDIMNLFIGGAS